MSGRQLLSCLKFGIWLLVLPVLTGCLSDYGEYNGNSSRGIPLSQAMKSSASGSHEPLHGSGSSETYSSVDVEAQASGSTSTSGGGSGGGLSLVSYEKTDYTWQILADTASVIPFNGEIQYLNRFTLTPITMEDDYNHLGLFLSGDIVKLQPGSLPDRAVDNVWMFEAGLEYRRYLTPAHVFISPYLSVGLAGQLLSWDYRNPVYVDGGSIQSDSLAGAGGYAGFGVAFKRNSHLSFFGEADFGGTAFVSETTEGFDNDVFSNYGYFMVRAGLSLKF